MTVIEDGDKKYFIVGTAHVSEQSRQEVADLIEREHPDKVCVELCQERYDSFYDTDRWKKLNIFEVIRKGKFLYLLANLAISAYQRKMGAKLGVKLQRITRKFNLVCGEGMLMKCKLLIYNMNFHELDTNYSGI